MNEPIVNVLKELIKIKSPYVVLKLIKGADAPKIQIGWRAMHRQLDCSTLATQKLSDDGVGSSSIQIIVPEEVDLKDV